MTFSMDFSNDKPDIREPIPAGTLLYLRMNYTPGGADLPNTPAEQREGALTKASPPSDAYYLKAEFTVLRGPYKGRKFWGNLTVAGGKVDEKGNSKAAAITRQTIRLILDSSQGLKSTDESPEARAKRVIHGYRDLQGRCFVAKAKVEPAQNGYPAKNGLGQVMTVDMKGYPTEVELDNPTVIGAPAKDAPPPPAWSAPQQTAEQTQPPAPTEGDPYSAAPRVPVPPGASENPIPAWAAA